jgi:hypothetical protein
MELTKIAAINCPNFGEYYKQDPVKRSIKNKRKRLAWDEPFLERLLAALCAPTA